MLTIEGTYKNGQVILTETPTEVVESKVLVTFLETKEINLSERGINSTQAAELRAKLGTMAEDWNKPEMDVYDVD
jgi:spore cortex formation protein SpoVR/YcgB (stage V sporulation)